MIKKFLVSILLIVSFHPVADADTPDNEYKAAFIRGDDMWIKIGINERRLTKGDYIRYPKWSSDGEWIAYLKAVDVNGGSVYNGDLWVYNVKLDKAFHIKSNVNTNFQWAPKQNKLGFMVNKDLYVLKMNAHFLPAFVAASVDNFSWLPDSGRILVSTRKSEQFNSDVILSKIRLRGNRQKPSAEHFYTINVGENEIVAGTSQFKWSKDKKWISFLLIPTASLSADGNTLCLLSSDGRVFHRVDEMLNYPEWMMWSPGSGGSLGYIGGTGREATFNKHLKVVNAPSFQVQNLTPAGFADRDLFWKNMNTLLVSRSVESDVGSLDERPLPGLYEINLAAGKQKQVTAPGKNEGDFAPQVLQDNLVWIRTDRRDASVMVSSGGGGPFAGKVWIKNLSIPSWYYEKWNWAEVFDLYRGLE
jgi:hypothetical protein